MKKIDVFVAAKKNSSRVRKEFKRESSIKPDLKPFAKAVEKQGRVSVNRNQHIVRTFLAEGALVAAPRSIKSKESFQQFLLRVWPSAPRWYHHRRDVFCKIFKHGDDHLFGALNAGGAGTAAQDGAYGHYCIVLKEATFSNGKNVAYCKHDTLAHDLYWWCKKYKSACGRCPARKPKAEIDDFFCKPREKKLLQEYACHSVRAQFATLKHIREIKRKTTPDRILICYRKDAEKKELWNQTEEYIEACFLGPMSLDNVEEIRLHHGMAGYILDEATYNDKALNEPMYYDSKRFQSIGSFVRQHMELVGMMQYRGIPVKLEGAQ